MGDNNGDHDEDAHDCNQACIIHDLCYSTIGANRTICDRCLLTDISLEIQATKMLQPHQQSYQQLYERPHLQAVDVDVDVGVDVDVDVDEEFYQKL